MSLGDHVRGRLPYLQSEAESMMTLTLRAYSPNGWTEDPDGYQVPAYADEGTTPGKVQGGTQGRDTQMRYVTIGSVERPVLTGGLHIPLTAPVPTAGTQRGKAAWEYEVEAVGPNDDPALLGRRFLVVEVPAKSYATARRLDVAEIPQEA